MASGDGCSIGIRAGLASLPDWAKQNAWEAVSREGSQKGFCNLKGAAMNAKHVLPLLALASLLGMPATAFGQGKVTITSPADGATLDALDEHRLVYEVDPGPRGDHVHVYLDSKEIGILRKLKGSYLLETPSAGRHGICVKVVNKAHVPVGIEECVQVTMK